MGPSGSGQSTIARLLFRFYDPDHGAVRVNGKDIRNVDVASPRAAFGVVPQDVTLFNDTLYHNIAYGRLDATKADIEQAAILARLDELIDRMEDAARALLGLDSESYVLRSRWSPPNPERRSLSPVNSSSAGYGEALSSQR